MGSTRRKFTLEFKTEAAHVRGHVKLPTYGQLLSPLVAN